MRRKISDAPAFNFEGATLMARTLDRTKPPETPPIPSYKMPPVHQTRLPNGLTVVLVEEVRFPLVNIRLSFQAGTKFDPEDLPGLAEAVASLLMQGTRTRSFRDLAEELSSIGATLRGYATPDVLTLTGTVLSENAPKLLDLLADVALQANFPENEVQLRRQNRKQSLLVQRSQPSFLAEEMFDEVIFGRHPYAHIAPTIESLDCMDQNSLVRFRDTFLAPNNAVLTLVGRLPAPAQTKKLTADRFGSWEQRPLPSAPAKKFPESERRLVLVDRPHSVQADIHLGRLAATRTDPDYYPLLVGNTILGGGASSRLFVDVREEKGFAYDAHSELDRRRDAGVFAAVTQVRTEVVEPAIEAVVDNLSRMAAAPVTAAELSDTKNFMSGQFLISLETQASLADQVDLVQTMGLPEDYLETFTARVRSVNADQIRAAAQKYFLPDRAAIVVVGDASKIQKTLEKFGEVQVESPK